MSAVYATSKRSYFLELLLFLFIVLAVLVPTLVFGQDVSTPPAQPLPGVPPQVQYVWLYYVAPAFVGVYMIMLAISHLPQAKNPGSGLARFVTWFFSGARAAARIAHIPLPDDPSVTLPLTKVAVQSKTPQPPDSPKPPGSGGYARFGLVFGLAAFGLLVLPGCKTLSGASGTTGQVQVGKVTCELTLAPTDPVACTKLTTNVCQVPEPKDASGKCSFLTLDTGSLHLGKGYSCRIAAAESTTPCVATVTTSCILPIARDADGHCQ